jgi:hypothetical protein
MNRGGGTRVFHDRGRPEIEFRINFHNFRNSIKFYMNFYRFELVLDGLNLTDKTGTRSIFEYF